MILIVEPFFTGSHKAWAEGWQLHSKHRIEILSLPGRYWKWRMHGAAVTLAQQFLTSDLNPDLIVVSDMLDLTTFQALTRERTANIPFTLYFHENQLTYPWSPTDEDVKINRDNHYSFINYTSALAADKVRFNSNYHLNSFFDALPDFLSAFPDHQNLESIEQIKSKSKVLPLGLNFENLSTFHKSERNDGPLVFLWNHRWEYDKNPDEFFEAFRVLKAEGHDFRLVVVGESYSKSPAIFEQAKQLFANEIVHWGYAESFDDYAKILWEADVIPVTSRQDFFGISAAEAMFCETYPLFPNRLAFPEHVPQDVSNRSQFYYDDFEGLLNRLRWTLENSNAVRETKVSQFVSRYDWGEMKYAYDNLFG